MYLPSFDQLKYPAVACVNNSHFFVPTSKIINSSVPCRLAARNLPSGDHTGPQSPSEPNNVDICPVCSSRTWMPKGDSRSSNVIEPPSEDQFGSASLRSPGDSCWVLPSSVETA